MKNTGKPIRFWYEDEGWLYRSGEPTPRKLIVFFTWDENGATIRIDGLDAETGVSVSVDQIVSRIIKET